MAPARCKNFGQLGKERFVAALEQIIRRDINAGFKGLDRAAVGRITRR